jgi:hypothetical protein
LSVPLFLPLLLPLNRSLLLPLSWFLPLSRKSYLQLDLCYNYYCPSLYINDPLFDLHDDYTCPFLYINNPESSLDLHSSPRDSSLYINYDTCPSPYINDPKFSLDLHNSLRDSSFYDNKYLYYKSFLADKIDILNLNSINVSSNKRSSNNEYESNVGL